MAERLQIDENAVRSEYNTYVRRHPEAGGRQVVISRDVAKLNAAARGGNAMAVAEENILRYLLERPAAYGRVQKKIEAAYFTDPKRRAVYEEIERQYTAGGQYTAAAVQDALPPDIRNEAARILVLEDVPLDEQVLVDYVMRFRLAALQADYKKHSELAAAYSLHDDPRLKDALAACKNLSNEIKQLVLSTKKGAHDNGN
ncbi:DnaB-like helicase N-terminal domain-containing protein [Anaeroglobus geminatus]